MHDNPLIKLLLFPLSLIYGVIVFIRNKLFDSGILPSVEFHIPVISVGNLTLGGTGKTPLIEYIAELLRNEFTPAVLSRGYRRKTRGFLLADENSTPYEIGDEPTQIKKRFPDIIVAVSENRVRGVKNLLQIHPETDVILLDDAFQHRYIQPGLSILLIDYNKPVTKDFLLPAGTLREPACQRKRANIILVTKCPEKLKPIERRIMQKELDVPPFQNLYFSTIEYGSLTPVFSGYPSHDPSLLKQNKPSVIILTGISNPRPLKRFARGISVKITEMIFPDHHFFRETDIIKISETFKALPDDKKIVLTTWKDAVRLQELNNIPEEIKKVLFFVPIKVSFLNDDSTGFSKQILNYVRNNKRNSILYKE